MEEKKESVSRRVKVRPSFCVRLTDGRKPVFEGQIVSVTDEDIKGQEYKVEFIDSKEYIEAMEGIKEPEVKDEKVPAEDADGKDEKESDEGENELKKMKKEIEDDEAPVVEEVEEEEPAKPEKKATAKRKRR